MKKVSEIVCFILLTMIIGCQSDSKQELKMMQFYHENGNLKLRYYLDSEEEIQGKVYRYDSLGNLYSITSYVNSVLEGDSDIYYSTGELRSNVIYKNDNMEGYVRYFYPTGQLKMLVPVESSERDGIGIYLDKSGDTTGFDLYRDNIHIYKVRNIGTDSVMESGLFSWAWSYNMDTLSPNDTFELFVTSAVPPKFENHKLEIFVNGEIVKVFESCYNSYELETMKFYSVLTPGLKEIDFRLVHPYITEENEKIYSKRFSVFVSD